MGGGRSKNTSIKLPSCIKLAFTLFLCVSVEKITKSYYVINLTDILNLWFCFILLNYITKLCISIHCCFGYEETVTSRRGFPSFTACISKNRPISTLSFKILSLVE